MRYLMRQQLFAWGEDFTVCDADGREVYFVDGRAEAYHVGARLRFLDLSGNELAFINEEVFSLGPSYKVFRDGALHASVKKAMFHRRSQRFAVKVVNVGSLDAEGDFIEHNYAIHRDDKAVVTISRQWFADPDSYGVEVAPGEDVVLLLAITVAIDSCVHRSTHHA